MEKYLIKKKLNANTTNSQALLDGSIDNGEKSNDEFSSSIRNIEPSLVISNKLSKDTEKVKFDCVFEKLNSTVGRKMVRCKVCYQHQQAVLLNCKQKNHIPPICTEFGTFPRKELMAKHLKSNEHTECLKVERLSKLSEAELQITTPINKYISQQNKELAEKIAQYICTIFNDSKRGTLSAWSWPSREVVALKRERLKISEEFHPFIPKEGDLQYINPTSYRDFSKCIVEADISNFKEKLRKCLAISLRVDGSVDRTQIDNIHILAKVITENGEIELVFIGFKEPNERGAQGHFNAIRSAINELFDWKEMLNMISSLVTDGASVNVGQKSGLWALFEENRKEKFVKLPLLKMWCAVHRSALAWESLTTNVIELYNIIQLCSSISTYFHQSGVRTKELKKIAEEENVTVKHLPKYFEIRWTEFTYDLLVSVLKNWKILVKFFKSKLIEEKDAKADGFYRMLTNLNTLKLLCFITDLGYLYSRFQKQIQSDDILIFDIEERRNILVNSIENLRLSTFPGGWEDLLKNKLVYTSSSQNSVLDTITLMDLELFDKDKDQAHKRKKKRHNYYVSENRCFTAIRHDTIEHILTYFNDRLDTSNWSMLKPLAKLSDLVTDAELKNCHKIICPDYELNEFVASYREASGIETIQNQAISEMLLKKLLKNTAWKSLSVSVARIIAAKPHSADVERLVSYYNIMKTSKRSSLSPDVLNNALYIKFNMSTVSQFNPLPAVIQWLKQRNRHSKIHPKATLQEYFEGVFDKSKSIKKTHLLDNKVSF